GTGSATCNAMSFLQDRRYDRSGYFIVGTENDGLKLFDTATERVRDITLYGFPHSMDSWKVHDLMEDAQGNIWAAAYQTGLLIIPKSMFGFRSRTFNEKLAANEDGACVTSTIEDISNGSTWVGTDGGGLFQMSSDGKTMCYSANNSALPNNSVMGLAIDKRGRLWIATYLNGIVTYTQSEGFRQFKGNGELGTSKIFCIAYDEKEDIVYTGSHGNGLGIIDPESETVTGIVSDDSDKWINALFIDSMGYIWVGTDKGPLCYNPASGSLSPYTTSPELAISKVNAISQDSAGNIWFGTDSGLISVERATGKPTVYNEDNGLSHNNIKGILEDSEGNIWASTSNGLSELSPATGQIRRFYAYDGLQGNEFRTNSVYKSVNGRLSFGGNNGQTSFLPQNTENQSHKVPQVYFTRLIVGDAKIEYDNTSEDNVLDSYITDAESIVLPHSKNSFCIHFTATEFSNPQRVRYTYRLDKYDKCWRSLPFTKEAIYSNLPQGRYTLTVKAFFDGQEDEFTTRSIKIRILPPPALSVWAIMLYVLIATGLAMLIFDYFRNKARRKKELEESNIKQMKINMFTNLSHDIRTPLTLVMSPLKKMREKETDPDKKDLYNLMYRNSLRILRLVNQVMDIQKVDEGNVKLHFCETDAVYFIKDIMKSFEDMALSKDIKVNLTSKKPTENLWVDLDSFDKIIFNVISNAFKYTPEGGSINIGISDKDDGHVEISVANTGSHIDGKDLEKIFDRYYQSDVYDTKGGSGVGLNLTKKLVELHRGSIEARNTEDGVTFIISLPTGKGHLKEEEISDIPQNAGIYSKAINEETLIEKLDTPDSTGINDESKAFKTKRNLVFIDDNVEMLKYIKLELKDFYNIEVFDNTKDAWASVTANQPDVIVTDLIMSTEYEGMEFCDRIKHNPGTNHIPVIILTSKADEDSIQKCNESGADKYLIKPVSTALLKSAINQAISTRDTIRNKYANEVGYDYDHVKMNSSEDKLLNRVLESIKANIDNPDYGVEDLSRDVGMSRVHMNRKLKECISLSPSNLIKAIRLKQAAYLLANNKVNISEVAYRVGFSTHSYFSSSFHDYFGLTPKEFVAKYSDSKDEESLKKLLEL
ncbi:MAG: two-component regulator propeller domain-containing protein, partial [Bacteroidia bacterium]|nr:two-component regulator propeller domain-containing protein [Bacteroidia bacterium]